MSSNESILAFEACGTGISVCYRHKTDGIVYDHSIHGFDAKHQLPLVLHQCIETYGLPDALATATGPGSFTGLRVTTVAARSLAWIENLPVYNINSLEALAYHAGIGRWLCVLALKKDTTFYALYTVSDTGLTQHGAITAQLDTIAPQFPAEIANATVIGPALLEKENLASAWGLSSQQDTDNTHHLHANMLFTACAHQEAQPWDRILPQYHQASAPELQRQEKERQEKERQENQTQKAIQTP